MARDGDGKYYMAHRGDLLEERPDEALPMTLIATVLIEEPQS